MPRSPAAPVRMETALKNQKNAKKTSNRRSLLVNVRKHGELLNKNSSRRYLIIIIIGADGSTWEKPDPPAGETIFKLKYELCFELYKMKTLRTLP